MIKKINITSSAGNFHKDNALSCDWKPASKEKSQDNKSRIIKFKKGFKWSGVKTEKYKKRDRSWSDIVRNVLIGNHGETAKFHLRYFEITPEGYSSLERHRHEHVVVCIRGKGEILIDKRYYNIGYLDTVYVAPHAVHQLKNPYNEPFGFFCIVNSKRDKPKIIKR
jgi:ribulose-bisphosphate carboxylase large chain